MPARSKPATAAAKDSSANLGFRANFGPERAGTLVLANGSMFSNQSGEDEISRRIIEADLAESARMEARVQAKGLGHGG